MLQQIGHYTSVERLNLMHVNLIILCLQEALK